jgi:hypothetical protein
MHFEKPSRKQAGVLDDEIIRVYQLLEKGTIPPKFPEIAQQVAS